MMMELMQYSSVLMSELTPEYGLGYSLGIIGGVMMLLLLLYPLKKRLPRSLVPFSTRFWFRAHMLLGILGPVAILFHSKFSLGSTNSTMAFWFMITVMSSGLVGRYLYRKIHMGLYGRRKKLEDLLHQVDGYVAAMAGSGAQGEDFARKASYLRSLIPAYGSLSDLLTRRRKIRVTVKRLLQAAENTGDTPVGFKGWMRRAPGGQRALVRNFDRAVAECISFRFYEKLFSLWHVLHLPIFLAFVLAVTVHIWAVHAY